jgi:hypothetical protein
MVCVGDTELQARFEEYFRRQFILHTETPTPQGADHRSRLKSQKMYTANAFRLVPNGTVAQQVRDTNDKGGRPNL